MSSKTYHVILDVQRFWPDIRKTQFSYSAYKSVPGGGERDLSVGELFRGSNLGRHKSGMLDLGELLTYLLVLKEE